MEIYLALIARECEPLCVARGSYADVEKLFAREEGGRRFAIHKVTTLERKVSGYLDENAAFEEFVRKAPEFRFTPYTEYVEGCRKVWRQATGHLWAGENFRKLFRITPTRIEIVDPANGSTTPFPRN